MDPKALYYEYFKKSPIAICVVNAEGKIIEANAAGCELTGYTETELKNFNLFELVDPEWLAYSTRHFTEVNQTGVEKGELRIVRKDGRRVWITIDAVKIDEERMVGFCLNIDDRKAAEEALKKSEDRLRNIFDNTPDLLLQFSFKEGLTYLSPSVFNITGYRPEEILGDPYWALGRFYQDNPELIDKIEAAVNSGILINPLEFRFHHKNGAEMYFECNMIGLVGEYGQLERMEGVLRDITRRRKAENLLLLEKDLAVKLSAISSLQEMLQSILESLLMAGEMDSGGIYLLNPDGSLRLVAHQGLSAEFIAQASYYSNDAPQVAYVRSAKPVYRNYFELEGIKYTSVQNQEQLKAFGLIPIKCKQEVIGCLNIASHTQKEISTETRSVIEALVAQIGGAISRIRAEEEVAEARRAWEDIFQGIGHPTMILDTRHKVVAVNRALIREAKLSESEMVGKKCYEIFHGANHPPVCCPAETLLQSQHLETVEMEMEALGRVFTVSCTPMINKENKLDRIIHIATDITEHKQAQEKLKQQQLNLENLVEELESFSFSIAHDLRTPLWTIEGFADILRNEFKEIDDGQRSNYIERIYLASHHMSQLIADTLEMIRISKIELKKERIDLSRLTGKVFTQLKENYPERRISMSIAPDLEVWGDAKLLELAIRNLISNALKFTGKNPQAVIELEKLQKEGQEIYFLADNGVGFDIRYAEKIFRAFERLHPDAEFEGTGVGLAIVQSIIKKHGGQVWAEGKIDRGATFYFTLD